MFLTARQSAFIALFLILISLVLFFTPATALGQFFGSLVPCGESQGGKLVNPCQSCHVTALAQRIINFLVYLAGVAAIIIFTYAGVLYASSSASPGNIEKAHGVFGTVLLGFVIVLVAWLLVDVTMKTFLDPSFEKKYFPWNAIQCVAQPVPKAPTVPLRPDLPMPADFDEKEKDDEEHWRSQGYNCVTRDSASRICTEFQNKDNSADTVRCLDFDAEDKVCHAWSDDPESEAYQAALRDELLARTNPALGSSCAPPSGGCSDPAFLSQFTSPADARTASLICMRESAGVVNAGVGVRTDKMLLQSGQPGFSFGLMQVNIAAHQITCGGTRLDCPSVFDTSMVGTAECERAVSAYERELRISARLLRGGGYCHRIKPEKKELYDQCVMAATDISCNGQNAARLRQQTGGWGPWAISANRVVQTCGI